MYKAGEGPRLAKISNHKEEQGAMLAILAIKPSIKHNNEEAVVLVQRQSHRPKEQSRIDPCSNETSGTLTVGEAARCAGPDSGGLPWWLAQKCHLHPKTGEALMAPGSL